MRIAWRYGGKRAEQTEKPAEFSNTAPTMRSIKAISATVGLLLGLGLTSSIDAAVHLSTSGAGQVLIYPYYSAQGGIDTLMTVANPTDRVKAIRVRFLDAVNARTVFQFNLYLGARDTWVGAVTGSGNGRARLVRADNSCTVPAIPQSGALFETDDFGEFVDQEGDGSAEQALEDSPSRTLDGYIEVIEMGAVDETADPGASSGLEAAAQAPTLDCDRLIAAWSPDGIWSRQRGHDVSAPTGGIAGSASLIDVAQGFEWGFRAMAISDFFTPASDRSTLHFAPSDEHPHLADVNTETETQRDGVARTLIMHEGRALVSDWALTRANGAGAADPVSALLMAAAIRNEVIHDEGLDGRTNWVLTYPTMRFYTRPSISDTAGQPVSDAIAPFGDTSVGELRLTYHSVGRIVEQQHRFWNRDAELSDPGSSCGTPLCPGRSRFDVDQTVGAAGVLLVGDERQDEGFIGVRVDDLFGTTHGLPFRLGSLEFVDREPIGNGFAEVRFDIEGAPGRVLTSLPSGETGEIHRFHGLPVLGFAAIRLVNGTLIADDGQRILANYGKALPHIRVRRISVE